MVDGIVLYNIFQCCVPPAPPTHTLTPLAVLYSACKVGDLDTVRDLLPNVPEAVNEFLQGGINLLMW